MIKNNKFLSMIETMEYLKGDKDSEPEIKNFIKKFVKLRPKEAKEMRKKLQELDLLKLKEDYAVKIIDMMPENQENLNKIFTDVSLNEDEAKQILDIIKEFK